MCITSHIAVVLYTVGYFSFITLESYPVSYLEFVLHTIPGSCTVSQLGRCSPVSHLEVVLYPTWKLSCILPGICPVSYLEVVLYPTWKLFCIQPGSCPVSNLDVVL